LHFPAFPTPLPHRDQPATLHPKTDTKPKKSENLRAVVLNREVGSPEAMRLQLEHLQAVSGLPNVIIQVIRGSKYFFGLEGNFEIATGEAIPDTLVMVASVEDQNSQDKANLREATRLFRDIQSRALNVEDSRTLIREALQRWSQQQ
jgi:hypothetical protein